MREISTQLNIFFYYIADFVIYILIFKMRENLDYLSVANKIINFRFFLPYYKINIINGDISIINNVFLAILFNVFF